ncbi:energy-coupling factor ABC transporter ATP-binding protein [Bacillus timonensis]|uniref:Energy-coupling factor ABC transporter ATP-binding protein n=1 Tax=Bacillus timonensis TaxID=1033734 RepID=A0A4S3PMZ1_9BACI|nr:ATP-binding cassette domain-containing protein [Bacillus timonensis]THE10869.1 energy-coupling factor ABC transporter ATP-binding protein [Bacillus timonensis]
MESIAYVEDLRLTFPGDQPLLFKDVSCHIKKGEKILILGPSGCGKSTLLQVLCGIIPNSIEVPMKVKKQQIPEEWGYVFQNPDTQFCMPYVDEELAFVLENLQIPRNQMEERIKRLLVQVGLELEDIHTNIQTLSGGMKQRLAIASSLALEPDVLFLDEPTAMLDPVGTKEIWEVIKKIGGDKTLIIVEHKLEDVLEIVDRVILFNEAGEIMADGLKAEVFSRYKNLMLEQGIWYPGFWDHFVQNFEWSERKVPQVTNPPSIGLKKFKGYRQKKERINIHDIQVYPGEWIVIKGKNGAGKSTLLHSLMQFIKTTGRYSLFGDIVTHSKRLDKHMAFVFQNPELQFVTNSVVEEIAYSLRIEKRNEREISKTVEELLQIFQLKKHQNKHPYQLSMGQKRRLSVAASIVRGQQILLLDEPTFGLDLKNTFALLTLLEKYRQKNKTIIMVSHDERIEANFATRVWMIEDGKLIKDLFPDGTKVKRCIVPV